MFVQLLEDCNAIYLLFAGWLTLLMFFGLSLFAAGLIRSKNISSLLSNNLMALFLSALAFFGIGYELMAFNQHCTNPYFPNLTQLWTEINPWSRFDNEKLSSLELANAFYQFAKVTILLVIITSITAERLRLWSVIIFTIFMAGIIYPVENYWFFGGGFLQQLGFIDHAGGGTIHLTGAAAALMCLLLIGKRSGKTKTTPITGSNIPLSLLGIYLALLGSFGLNSGYLIQANTNLLATSLISIFLANMTVAAASAFMISVLSRLLFGKTDITLVMNGALMGIVAIAACPALHSLNIALLLGLGTGFIGIFAIVFIDKIGIDDPVGGIAVHGVGGMLSLIFAAFTGTPTHVELSKQLLVQLDCMVIILVWSFVASLVIWILIRLVIGLRAINEEETRGLDLTDCGIKSYPEFVIENKD
jgi:Amt family ammonium transporter